MEELVSCILSQSSTDSSSFPAFTRLRAAYPDWQAMEDAGPEGILPHIVKAGLGPSKSRAIVGALRMIREEAGSHSLGFLREMPLPEARDWLCQLPGVGLKTASIVLCFAFGREAIPVDTHVFRVAGRLGMLPPKCSLEKAHHLLLQVVDPKDAFRFHTLLIQHGRLACSAQKPACPGCPLALRCPAGVENQQGRVKEGDPPGAG